ncbi:MAG: RNA-directed DNA polymerase [Actinomycetota bacterium]
MSFEAVPKPGGVRVIARLSDPVAAGYRDAVSQVVPRIEASLGAAVAAERLLVRSPRERSGIIPVGLREARARARSRAHVLAVARPGPVVLADVRSCYAGIRPSVEEQRLVGLGAHRAALDVRAQLERFGELGVDGLPVGPRESALLANAVLGVIDEEIVAAGAFHVRWVDDLAIFPGNADPERVLERLAEMLDRLGLSLATEKCAIGTLDATRFGRSLLTRAPRASRLCASLG